MLLTYPAIFFKSENEKIPYYITFPDIGGVGTQGEDISDGMAMASDYLGIMLADLLENNQTLPKPSKINNIDLTILAEQMEISYLPEDSFTTLVSVELDEYLSMDEPKKKTLTIPKWADKLGMDLRINFSQTLVEAIVEKAKEK